MQALGDREAVDAGHHDVEQDRVEASRRSLRVDNAGYCGPIHDKHAADSDLRLCLVRMLNLYDDARHYDALFPGPNDLPFYQRQIAAHGGPVLELACGTGRLTVQLAAAGADITGIDRSPSMLEAARNRAARNRVKISFQEGDIRDYDLGRKFKLIFIRLSATHRKIPLRQNRRMIRRR